MNILIYILIGSLVLIILFYQFLLYRVIRDVEKRKQDWMKLLDFNQQFMSESLSANFNHYSTVHENMMKILDKVINGGNGVEIIEDSEPLEIATSKTKGSFQASKLNAYKK